MITKFKIYEKLGNEYPEKVVGRVHTYKGIILISNEGAYFEADAYYFYTPDYNFCVKYFLDKQRTEIFREKFGTENLGTNLAEVKDTLDEYIEKNEIDKEGNKFNL